LDYSHKRCHSACRQGKKIVQFEVNKVDVYPPFYLQGIELIINHWIREKRGMVDFYARAKGNQAHGI